jgi:hypothetical protein
LGAASTATSGSLIFTINTNTLYWRTTMKRDSYSDQQAHASFQPRSSQPAIKTTQLGQPAHHSSSTSDVGAKWLSKASSWVADQLQTAQNFVSSGDAISPDQILPALKGTVKPALSQADRTNQPLVGVIDSGFGTDEHGSKMVEAIQKENPQAKLWQGGGVGTGGGLESLVQFVDVAKATGQPRAVANLSFDLTEVHPDGSSSTRAQLTAKEQSALSYARDNGVLVVASSGNQGGAMSALGQASQPSDNLIVVGAANGGDRASYSSYGNGLDLVADVGAAGTSSAAATVTGTIANIWSANPELSSQQVNQMLTTTATDLKTPGWDTETGAGLLNSTAAVNLATMITPETQTFSGGQLGQRVNGSFNNSAWISANGSVASERTNRLPNEGDSANEDARSSRRSLPDAWVSRRGLQPWSTSWTKNGQNQFRTNMSATLDRKIKANPNSPLKAFAEQDKNGTWKLKPEYEAGHTGSNLSGTREMFAIEHKDRNRETSDDEKKLKQQGTFLRKRAVSIDGVAVEIQTARNLEARGEMPKGTVENARLHPGEARTAPVKSGEVARIIRKNGLTGSNAQEATQRLNGMADRADKTPGGKWRGTKVTGKSVDVVRDQLIRSELRQNNNLTLKDRQALQGRLAAGNATDADLAKLNPENKARIDELRGIVKDIDKKPDKRPFHGRSELYAFYDEKLRDSVTDTKNPARGRDVTDSRQTGAPKQRGGTAPFIAHRDKPDEANPDKKRSVKPADRSPRQPQTTRTVSPSNPSTKTQKSKPSAVNTRATVTPPRPATITPPRLASITPPRLASITPPRLASITPPRPASIPSGLKPVARVAGRVFKPLGAAVDVYEIGSAIYKDGGIGSNTKQVATDAVVGWAKTAAGAGIGAAIGSVVPVLGTGVGAVVGGIVGSFL